MNNTTRSTDTFTWTSVIPVYVGITMWSILLVWSLVGNVLVIAVVYCNQNLRTNMNYLIVNMAVSDLLIPLVKAPRVILSYTLDGAWLVEGPLGEALCKLVPFLAEISPFVSSISLVIIALQRFMAVVYPTRGQVLSRKRRWIAISFPWIIAMALNSPYFYTLRLTNIFGYTMCISFWSLKAFIKLFSIKTAVGFVVPLISIIILYTITIYKLRENLNNVMDLIGKEAIRTRQRTNRRIFSMLITIIVLFTICWGPYSAISPYIYTDMFTMVQNADAVLDLLPTFRYLWYLLAAINPCIYFVFLRDFRQGLKRLCCRKTVTANEQTLDDPEHQVEIVTRTQHVHHFTSTPLLSRMNINTRRPRTPGGDSNQDPTCTPPHINTTSV